MALTIEEKPLADVVILRLQGRLTLGEETNSLREAIRGLLEKGHKRILLNLQGVSYIDSAGVGTLVSVFTSVRSRSGVLKLVGISTHGRDLLQVTKLLTVFDVPETEEDALKGRWSGI
jgi:anti-sigma B factor antagonist